MYSRQLQLTIAPIMASPDLVSALKTQVIIWHWPCYVSGALCNRTQAANEILDPAPTAPTCRRGTFILKPCRHTRLPSASYPPVTTREDPFDYTNASAPVLQALLEERVRLHQEMSDLRVYGHDAHETERRLRDIACEIRRLRQQWRQAI
jgi:hypothetical protein